MVGGLVQSKLCCCACFRVAGCDLGVETRKWDSQAGRGTRLRVPLPRAERLCTMCGVGDGLYVVAEYQCTAYAAVGQRHAHVFEGLGVATGGAQEGVLSKVAAVPVHVSGATPGCDFLV